jgi:hypothetical protein
MNFAPFDIAPFDAFYAPPAPPAGGYRDRQLLALVADLLRATGEFDEVTTWGLPEARGSGAQEDRLAALELRGWEESDQSNDYAGIPQDRTVAFALTILVRIADPDPRDDEADRLLNVAMNALNGASLAGANYPDRTRLRRGAWLPARAPERRLVAQGQFTYPVPDFPDHQADPD